MPDLHRVDIAIPNDPELANALDRAAQDFLHNFEDMMSQYKGEITKAELQLIKYVASKDYAFALKFTTKRGDFFAVSPSEKKITDAGYLLTLLPIQLLMIAEMATNLETKPKFELN